ncbi:MAG: tRNA 4-thiouridine(8) synthase ThiI [Candidatus Bathyarchaeota archaeon]|nr:tRNA 4-thiouridine(8) synthase ThiI [Candidatus Bathyarchaeota archaeon]
MVRFSGEIGIKSDWTRHIYEKQVLQNIKYALKKSNLKPDAIERTRGRIYIKTQKVTPTSQLLIRTFGVSSISPAKQTTSDLNAVSDTAISVTENTIKQGATFAVRCHRVGNHPYTSMELCREVGSQILTKLKHKNLTVNLTEPNITLTVEVRDKDAYVYTETLQAPGGFPLGVQAKTVCLLSGGIDSPVACWLVMKRGSPTVPIYVDNAPFTDEAAKQKAIQTAKKLQEWSAGFINKIYIASNGENMKKIQQQAPARFTCLLCKRMMYRIAEQIAKQENAYGIVTGEAIGEQASQTIQNLHAIDEAAKLYPIHRPLLGFDKTETELLAKKIGTFEISTQKAKGCTAAPNQPATQALLTSVQEAEAKLNIAEMVHAAIKNTEVLSL